MFGKIVLLMMACRDKDTLLRMFQFPLINILKIKIILSFESLCHLRPTLGKKKFNNCNISDILTNYLLIFVVKDKIKTNFHQ